MALIITYAKKQRLQLFKYIPWVIIIIAGLIIRYSFYNSIDGTITVSDSPTYVDGAMSLYYHLWLNEYRPPVYPLGLMLIGALFTWEKLNIGVIFLQILVSIANIVYAYKLSVEAFKSRFLGYICAFLIAVSFRVYNWDFIILSESFAIFLVTAITYYLIMFLKYNQKKHLKLMVGFTIAAIFNKPFFMVLPIVILAVLILKHFLGCFDIKRNYKTLIAGMAAIYMSIFLYSALHYAQSSFFGVTSVGNVNLLGKIMQYNMEDLGKNQAIINDIKHALETESPERIVNGKYLEPWHFVGTYGWTQNHYHEVGKFAKDIILRHPVKFTQKSLALAYRLFVHRSPFRDFIADVALIRADRPQQLMTTVRRSTEAIDSLYVLLILCFFEVIYTIIKLLRKREANKESIWIIPIFAIILYHYIISAFFSYGDYCRLLVPSYSLIYLIICMYLYRLTAFSISLTRRFIRHMNTKAIE